MPVCLAPPVTLAAVLAKGVTLQTRQLWDGTVTQVFSDGFLATLVDKTDPNNPDEEAMFEFGEVQEDDIDFVSPGSAFYWTIGSERTPAGQIRTVSSLQFRRIPTWTHAALEQVADRVQRLKTAWASDKSE